MDTLEYIDALQYGYPPIQRHSNTWTLCNMDTLRYRHPTELRFRGNPNSRRVGKTNTHGPCTDNRANQSSHLSRVGVRFGFHISQRVTAPSPPLPFSGPSTDVYYCLSLETAPGIGKTASRILYLCCFCGVGALIYWKQ
jgi:hypothetical protein